ncbi:membrane-bound alkaline phosphatase-like [Teleopsis dalmanni]|uniref:membrane-bound alkaline phosphatase-like n=1 Tax=Teleopsis dalmanni TaxID=139649 RepID=UPI0018CE7D35|nr:membrane-bound alkaline phosphatase-like [Teleopsis dalmanni]
MRNFILFCVLLTIQILTKCSADEVHPRASYKPTYNFTPIAEEMSTEFWMNKAQNILSEKLAQTVQRNLNEAKNIILFLGGGMSMQTFTAARSLMGDSSKQISFEKFPYIGLTKTYAINQRVPDAGSTTTAYLSGVKSNYGTIGVTAQVQRNDCHEASNTSTHTESLAKWAQDAKKWTGFVTTARVTYGSPAGIYAHTANRDWETDGDVERSGCSSKTNTDIARQLIEGPVGRNLRVVLGGGRRSFLDVHTNDEEGLPGIRTDKRNLIKEWLSEKKSQGLLANYVWSKKGLQKVDLSKCEYLLGLFSNSHCPYHGDLEREYLTNARPSLTDMTEAAIRVLSKSENGYFLFVDSAKIDMAHHDTKAHKALEDVVELARAVELAQNMTSTKDTLIVVTSNHAHTMTINGYPYRDQNIFGLAPSNADDGLPYTILSYANGPGYTETYSTETGRLNLSTVNLNNPNHRYMTTVPLSASTHGGEDVGVFASGPFEHYFTGNYEQTSIPALMAHAANIGPFTKNIINK